MDKRMISELEMIRKNVQFFFWIALATCFAGVALTLIALGV